MFAQDFLQLDDTIVTAPGNGAANPWLVSGERLNLEVTIEHFAAVEGERPAVWGVTRVVDLTDSDWYLTAELSSAEGGWVARIGFPPPDVTAGALLASGEWEVADNTDGGEITLELPARPTAPVRLFIFYYNHTELTGVHGVILYPDDLLAE